ncbi:MAG TPA: type II secretion system protein [Thermoanaerobaculia bacterium]|nr:type II secretion system protein [Thermoanaerobaculia bacterium]
MINTQLKKTRAGRSGQKGFTLIELIIVVTIIGILAGVAIMNVRFAQRKAREAALMDNLATMRKAIDNFYADKQRFPADLNELVPNYMRAVPKDPITKQTDWEVIMDDPLSAETGDGGEPIPSETDPEAMSQPGVVDVKSVAEGVTLDNVPYNEL